MQKRALARMKIDARAYENARDSSHAIRVLASRLDARCARAAVSSMSSRRSADSSAGRPETRAIDDSEIGGMLDDLLAGFGAVPNAALSGALLPSAILV